MMKEWVQTYVNEYSMVYLRGFEVHPKTKLSTFVKTIMIVLHDFINNLAVPKFWCHFLVSETIFFFFFFF